MRSYYRKLRQHILSCQDFQSLNECFDMVYNAWNVNDIGTREYYKLMKLMDSVANKGIKCIKIGL